MIPGLTLEDAAKLCHCSVQTIRRWMKDGRLKAVKLGGRYRTSEEWIVEMMKPASTLSDAGLRESKKAVNDKEYERSKQALKVLLRFP